MNSGTYTWHIEEPRLLRGLLSAKWKDHFDSDVFQIVKLNWKIKLRPNGFTEKSKGFCGLFVELLGMPSSWKSIFCRLHIECPEMRNKMVFSTSYNIPKSTGFYISSFGDVKASCGKQLTFIVKIHITRITLKGDNKILFQMPTNEYKTKTELQWKIGEQLMKKVKTFDKGKGICSDFLNDIWCLKLYPNGAWDTKDGNVVIGLWLCGLPPNVSKMSVQWTVHCHEANIKQTKTKDFDEENRGRGWGNNTISFSEFCKYNTWTVTVNVNVLNEFDSNGEDMTMKQIESEWNEYKQPQNDAIIPYPDTDLKGKLQFHDVAIESLSTNMQQIQKTLRSMSKAMEDQNNKTTQLMERMSNVEESKEERIHYNELNKQMSVLQQQMNEVLSANSQQKQGGNTHHVMVRKWLKDEVNLEQYGEVFIENGFEDLGSLTTLNMEILNMMQIEKIGHKMKILKCVAKLKAKDNTQYHEGTTACIFSNVLCHI